MEKKDKNKVFCPNYGFVDKTRNFLVLSKSALFEQNTFLLFERWKSSLGCGQSFRKKKQKENWSIFFYKVLCSFKNIPSRLYQTPKMVEKTNNILNLIQFSLFEQSTFKSFLVKKKNQKKTQFIFLMKCFGFYFSIRGNKQRWIFL